MASSKLVVWDDNSIVQVTPIVKDENGVVVGKGNPVEVKLSDLVTYLQTKTGWTA